MKGGLLLPYPDEGPTRVNRLRAIHLTVAANPIVMFKAKPYGIDQHVTALAEFILCVRCETLSSRRVGSSVFGKLWDGEGRQTELFAEESLTNSEAPHDGRG
tara:strand:+ start:175 stop:480 length:306 start_codon:yes stop_codon:yes gene_type:complete